MDADFPVYRGAARPWLREPCDATAFHGAEGLGTASLPLPRGTAEQLPMWDALYAAACRHAGMLHVVALGPLTNLATAFAKYPDLPNKLAGISIMGGAAVGGNRTPCAEFNIYVDPEAAQVVFRSGVPVVMCGLDVTEQAYLTADELEALAASRAGCFLRDSSRDALRRNVAAGAGGWCLHDVVPLLHLAAPELFTAREAGVFVETKSELTRGKTVTDLFSDFKFPEKNALVVLELDRTAFVQRLHALFAQAEA